MTDDDSMGFIVNRSGPNPEDTMVTSFSPALERARRLLTRRTIEMGISTAVMTFLWGWLLFSYHVPWYIVGLILLGVLGVMVASHNHGMVVGRYEMLRALSKAKITVRHIDLNKESEEEES
jgi:hypothetical protein